MIGHPQVHLRTAITRKGHKAPLHLRGGVRGETRRESGVYDGRGGTYTGSVSFLVQKLCKVFVILVVAAGVVVCAQEPAKESAKTPEKPASTALQDDKMAKAKSEEKAGLPFQIELLETRVRFEANGDSRKEVHTVVKINDAGGARQFARLGFDYNRAFQSVEIPLVKISHANGGTSEILPSAIGDVPNPAVEKFPAYQDVRVKTVRILGLQEGDTLEYRVITTTTKPPLRPIFWLEHTFDKSGQVLEEHYELDAPAGKHLDLRINPETPMVSKDTPPDSEQGRVVYRWSSKFWAHSAEGTKPESSLNSQPEADISLSSVNWTFLSARLDEALLLGSQPWPEDGTLQPENAAEIHEKAISLTKASKTNLEQLKAIYNFVSGEIRSVDLPLGATGFAGRPATEVLKAGYANAEDKYVLFAALARALKLGSGPALTGYCEKEAAAIPSRFRHLVISSFVADTAYWLDPSLEVAPFGLIAPVPGGCAFQLDRSYFVVSSRGHEWAQIPQTLPFAAFQKVRVESSISPEGTLKARLKYVTRGENELVLRMAFHQAPKKRWNEVAGLLALSDGFRGHIESVKASDPLETEKPFEVEYEITQPKFVDWSKKPVRFPALLPQIALPDAPGKTGGKIELGTPLDVETEMTLRLPEGTTVQTPPATSVSRDYATYASKYDGHLNTVTASRHIHFVLREIPGERAADYNAFMRAVKNDEGQAISLLPQEEKRK